MANGRMESGENCKCDWSFTCGQKRSPTRPPSKTLNFIPYKSMAEYSWRINKGLLSSDSLEDDPGPQLAPAMPLQLKQPSQSHTQSSEAGTNWLYLCRCPPQSCLWAELLLMCRNHRECLREFYKFRLQVQFQNSQGCVV